MPSPRSCAWLDADGVFLDTMKEAPEALRARARRGPPGTRVRGRVDAAARPDRGSPPVVGAVVRRQRRAGRDPRALVRAAAHAASHAPLEPRPRRRAAFELAERHRHARLGRRLRRLGGLERARQGAAPHDARRAAPPRRSCSTHGEWTPLAARSDDLQVVGSRWERSGETLWALVEPRPTIRSTASSPRRATSCGSSCRRGDCRRRAGRSRHRLAEPALAGVSAREPRCASLHRSVRVDDCPPGWSTVRRRAAQTRGLPPPRDRHVRRGAVRRGVEAAAAAAARLRRGRAARRPRPVRDRRARGDARRRAADERHARRGAGLRGLASAHDSRPRTNGRRRQPPGCSSGASRISGTGRRASIVTAGRASRSSRAAPTMWRRLRVVRRRRRRAARAFAEAAARRRRSPALTVDRVPAGGRPARDAPARRHPRRRGGDAVRGAARVDAARRLRRRRGQDRAPAKPDPARGHGPSKDGVGLWFKTLSRNKRLITLDLSQPGGRDVFLRLVERSDVVIENFRPGTLERWRLGPDELLARQPARS